jgi:hypothetical protein
MCVRGAPNWRLQALLTTDESALAKHETNLGVEPWMFGILE